MADNDTGLVVFSDNNSFEDDSNNLVNVRKNPDGSIQYSYTTHYQLENNELPKLHSVLLDPHLVGDDSEDKGEGVIASLLFKRYPSVETNLSYVKEHLNLIGAGFLPRTIDEEETNRVLFDVIRIYNNTILAIGYFSNLYQDQAKSSEASAILKSSLIPMIRYVYDRSRNDENKKIVAQNFGIKMSDWLDPEEPLLVEPRFTPSDQYCYENKTLNYLQQKKYTLEAHEYNIKQSEYIVSLDIYNKELNNKKIYIDLSEERKLDLFNQLLEIDTRVKVKKIIDGVLRDTKEETVNEMHKNKKLEEFLSVFETVEQCKDFLCGKYPEVEVVSKNITEITMQEFKRLEGKKWSMENVAKNTKDVASIISTFVFDFAIGELIVGKAMKSVSPVIGAILNTGKVGAIAAGLGLRNSWISPNEENAIDKPKLIEDFVCKAALCNIDQFMNMSIEEQEELGKSYAAHISSSLFSDKNTYSKQSTIVDSYLTTYGGNHVKNKCIEDIREKLGIDKPAAAEDIMYDDGGVLKEDPTGNINKEELNKIIEDSSEDPLEAIPKEEIIEKDSVGNSEQLVGITLGEEVV